ncbi:MAG: TonB-dependent receptor [Desulfobacterales bacterium]|nr:TonB-dependent receptor [Desulfobacterales bacterium]
MQKGFKASIMGTAAALLLLAPGTAFGSDVPEQARVETLIVTADKRETNIQELGTGITSLSDMDVSDGDIRETEDFIRQVPNLHMVKTGNHSMAGFLSIRGITGWMGGEPTVGFYVDDVFYSNFDTHLLDVERIEVLRGPQGTLYGRNTEAGVINIVSKAPSDIFEGTVQAEAGNYNTRSMSAALSIPVVDDTFYLRASGRTLASDGYFFNTHANDDAVDEIDDRSGRISAIWTPTDQWNIRLNARAMRFRDGNASFAELDTVRNDPHRVSVDYAGVNAYDGSDQSLRLAYRGSRVDITSITALGKEESVEKNDMDFTAADLMRLSSRGEYDRFSQEIRVASRDDGRALEWLGGLYYFNQDKRLLADVETRASTPLPAPYPAIPPFSFIRDSQTDTQGYAFFGQAGLNLTQKIKVGAGLRYDHEKKDFSSRQYYGPDLTAWGMAPSAVNTSDNWDAFLPKIFANYTFRPGMMVYASVSRGYKSGGFNSLAPSGEMAYDPEYTVNYELGAKTAWWDDRLILNLSVFHIDWTDQQVEQQRYPQAITKNSGKSTSRGFEVEATAVPVPGLEFKGGIGVVRGRFDQYTDDLLDPVTHAKIGTVDYGGKRIPNVPAYNFHVSATYRHSAGLFARAGIQGVGEAYYDAANTWKEPAYEVVNAKVGWEWEHVQLYFWGKNIFDKTYATRAFEMSGTRYGRAGDPATFGITLEGRF